MEYRKMTTLALIKLLRTKPSIMVRNKVVKALIKRNYFEHGDKGRI